MRPRVAYPARKFGHEKAAGAMGARVSNSWQLFQQ